MCECNMALAKDAKERGCLLAEAPPENEQDFKQWLEANALEVLKMIGLEGSNTVLDYGCGSGAFAIPAAKIVGSRGKVSALDTDVEALTDLRRKADSEGLSNIETILTNKSSPTASLPQGKFDAILLYDVLQMVDDKRSLFRKLHGALKPDGFLSVFPMHVGTDKTLELADEEGLFAPRDRRDMLLNFYRLKEEVTG